MTKKSITVPRSDEPVAPYHEIANDNGWKGTDTRVKARFAAAYNDSALMFLFQTDDAPRICRHFGDQAAVSCDSCVEAFIEPVPGGRYYNIEVNIGESINSSRRFSRHDSIHLTSDELATIGRHVSVPQSSEIFEPGNHYSWTCRINVPWTLLGVKPEPGMVLRANFYACASDAVPPYYLSWAPIDSERPDFHRPEFFGEIVLG